MTKPLNWLDEEFQRHVVRSDDGELPSRTNLEFSGMTVEDDEAHDTTRVIAGSNRVYLPGASAPSATARLNALWIGGSAFTPANTGLGTRALWMNVGATIQMEDLTANVGAFVVDGKLVPDFPGNASFSLRGSQPRFEALTSRKEGSAFVLFNADTATARPDPDTNVDWANQCPQLLGAGAFGIAFSNVGVSAWIQDQNGFPTVTRPCATAGWHLGVVTWNSAYLQLTLDADDASAIEALRIIDFANDGLVIGNYNVGFDGKIAAVGLSDTPMTPDDRLALYAHLQSWIGGALP